MQETAINLVNEKLPGFIERFKEETLSAEDFRGDLCLSVMKERLRDILLFLKRDPGLRFDLMMDIFAMDYLKSKKPTPERFAVIYNLYSLSFGRRVRVKVFLPERSPEIDSICDLWACADWFERETWDLYGIVFKGHPNLTRILCHQEFEGHPLRKDYPADKYQSLKKAALPSGM